jgi:hypothetical protein
LIKGENFDSWLWVFRKLKIAIAYKVAWTKEEEILFIDTNQWCLGGNEQETVGGKIYYAKLKL